MGNKKTAALYLRLSEDKRGTGENVNDQARGTRAKAESLSLEVVEVYNDNDRPCSDPERHTRPEFERMLSDAVDGLFSVLVIRHLDRLYRHPLDLLRIVEAFKPYGVTVEQEWAGHPLDLSNPTGFLHAGLLAQVNLYEIEHKKERQRAMNEALLRDGKPQPGGPRPFGFERDMTHRQDEAELIREATSALLSGVSLGSIIRDWNARGVRTTRRVKAQRGEPADNRGRLVNEAGQPMYGTWSYSNTRAVLLRWSNAGIRQTTVTDRSTGARTVVEHGRGTWDPIVSEDDFRALRALLCDESRIKHRGETGRKHLLSHLIRCGRCSESMRAGMTTTRAGVRYAMYQCPKCRLGVDYEAAESVVKGAVAGRLLLPSPSMMRLTEDERVKVGEAHTRLTQITEDEVVIEESRISVASKRRQLEALHAERERLQDALANCSRRMALAAMLAEQAPFLAAGRVSFSDAVKARQEAAERFTALDLDRKRQVIRALLAVTVVPSPRGVRPTKETARRRVKVTWLDPSTGLPEYEER